MGMSGGSPGSEAQAKADRAAMDADEQAQRDEALRDRGDPLKRIEHEQNAGAIKYDVYHSPGAAEYGDFADAGAGVDYYSKEAASHMADNNAQQNSNQGALDASLANMKGNRGMQVAPNSVLAGREAATRAQQVGSLGLNMSAAMGGAPSAAKYNTLLGMNAAAANAAGAAGSARGLSGLTGAQQGAGQVAGTTMGGVANQGATDRSGEIASAIGTYGQQAGQVRGQDLTSLGASNQNTEFNADLNDKWKLGNANLAIGQAGLGTAQQGMDQQWFGESMKPADIQFQMDQEAQGWQAGANTDSAAAHYAKDNQNRQNTQALVGGIAQVGLTGLGTAVGGPAGGAAAGMAGTAINSATKKYY